MKVSAVVTCFVVLWQFCGLTCYEYDHLVRTKRNHDCDCDKRKLFKDEHSRTVKSVKSSSKPADQIHKDDMPETETKPTHRISEKKEPKAENYVHILKEIATIAHDHNDTKGIEKIRDLVNHIAKNDEIKEHCAKFLNKENDVVKFPNKDKVIAKLPNKETAILKSPNKEKVIAKLPSKETAILKSPNKEKVISKLPKKEKDVNKNEKIVKPILPSNETKEKELEIVSNKTATANGVNKVSTEVKVKTPLLFSGIPRNHQISVNAQEMLSNHGIKLKDENLIEINEHKIEEEFLRQPPNAQQNAVHWGQSYNYLNVPYTYKEIGNQARNYNNIYNNYPLAYGHYNGNNECQIFDANTGKANKKTNVANESYLRYRKTWLDRDTVLNVRNPNEAFIQSIDEKKKLEANIQSPDFYKKYYSVTQKRYSSNNNEVVKNRYQYHVDPYQCS